MNILRSTLATGTIWLVFASVAPSQWITARHDPHNRASSERQARLVTTPVMRWRYQPTGGTVVGSYLASADLDGDGRPEVAVGSGPMGPGNEASGRLWVIDAMGNERWSVALDGYVKWASPVMACLDADSLPDVVVGGSWWSTLFALRGTWGDTLWTALSGLCQVGMNAGDLYGDGSPEVIVGDYQSPRHVRALDRTGSVLWTLDTSGTTYTIPAIGLLGQTRGVLFTCHAPGWRERLCFVDPAGREVWSYVASPTPSQLLFTPPELGYLPDYGYTSAVLADFDGDGGNEVGFGTDLNYYVLDANGTLRWRQPTGIIGAGFTAIVNANGDTVSYVDHHYQIMDAAVADLNGDGACDVVYGLTSDWWGHAIQGDPSSLVVTRVVYRSALVARSGIDGGLMWRFDARHPPLDPWGRGRMGEPVVCRVGQEAFVIAGGNDGYLYAVRGSDGELVWEVWGEGSLWQRGMALVDLDRDGVDELVVVHGGGIEAWSSLLAPTLSISLQPEGVSLRWTGDPATQWWRVYRASSSSFGVAEAQVIATLQGASTTFTDPAVGFLLNPAANAFYRVVGITGEASSQPSNEVGEFDWGMEVVGGAGRTASSR